MGTINGSLVSPTGFNSQQQNQTFILYANVTCLGLSTDTCGSVNASLWYNATTANLDNATLGSGKSMTPFYVLENNSWICGVMSGGDKCYVNWTVNATGSVGSTWELGVNFTSNNSLLLSNLTNYTLINIISSSISITLSGNLSSVNFGSTLDPGTNSNPALGNDPSLYNITCSNTGANCNISITSGGDFVSGVQTFKVLNATWGSISNLSANGIHLNASVGIINNTLGDGAIQKIFFWLTIPPGQSTGTYTSNFTITAVSN